MSIIVIGLFIVCPFISLPFVILGIALDKKNSKIYGVLLALLLALIAYNFIPKEEQDLYRYYYEMRLFYSHIDFERFLQDIINTKIIFKFLQFIFAQIGNFNLLPFITTFIGYAITFYIILDYSKIKKIKSYITVWVIIVFICTFYHINFISNLAQFLAITISFLGFYLEFVREKKGIAVKFLYLLPLAIHISTIICLAFRILLCFKSTKIKKYYMMFLFLYILLPSVLYVILNKIPGFYLITQKIYSYMLNGDKKLIGLYDYSTLFLLIFYTIIYYISRKRLKGEFSDKYIDFIEIVILFNISSIVYRDIFSRILTMTMLIFNVYFLTYFSKTDSKKSLVAMLGLLIFCLALGSVNINNLLYNNYNGIFENLTENVFYYFK